MANGPEPCVLAGDGVAEIEIKKSRFLGQVRRISDASQAAAIIAEVRKEHWQARHHCTAMVVAGVERSNDDGEPAGTAGAPMLQVLRGHGLTGVLAIVTRYFGGTLLGAGGLVRAYGRTVTEAVADAGVLPLVPLCDVVVTCRASDAGRCEHALRRLLAAHGVQEIAAQYGEKAVFRVAVPEALAGEVPALLASVDPSWPVRVGEPRLGTRPV